MTDTSIAPTKAAEKVLTENPFITLPKNQKSRPLTTSENNPRVTIFNGKVRMLIIGLMNMLNSVRQAPTTRAVHTTGDILIPDTTYVVATTDAEIIIQCKMIFIPYKILSLFFQKELFNL
jgi:hypothetical protein